MAATHLVALPNTPHPQQAPESAAQHIRRLQMEARSLAREEVEVLVSDLCAMAERVSEMGQAGDAYPIGVRELAPHIQDDIMRSVNIIRAIMDRTSHN